MMRIQFIGSGWLAEPAARHCQDLGHPVKVTTTDATKAQALQETGLPALVYRLGDELDPSSELLAADVLVIAITSKDVAAFARLLQQLDSAPHQPHLIFTSSTSVYTNNGQIHDESSEALHDDSPLRVIEQLVMESSRHTILRLAGLVGPGRHPGRFFQSGRTLKNPQARVNLVHLDDCIGVLQAIIEQHAWPQIFNVCADTHPRKLDFYQAMADQLQVPPPTFTTAKGGSDKVIDNQRIKAQLNYQLRHPDVMAMNF
ncbi:hypothetical protein [Marinicella meishanensis]|uniref:hypothetical protein n=1 Tax=Marinicella meishanensis TaxID=2873263 RepID=UPI001CBF605A|nr:hypothetical protein [Marinicella sp. NBU2979]